MTYTPPHTPPPARPHTLPGEAVCAIIARQKTQLRIPFNEQPSSSRCLLNHLSRHHIAKFAPWAPGQAVWIRETWGFTPPCHTGEPQLLYKATEQTWKDNPFVRWQSPAIMPVEYSRIRLRITNVRVQRIQEITGRDAKAEGVFVPVNVTNEWAKTNFQYMWNRQNSPHHEWSSNPWVWVYDFIQIPNQHIAENEVCHAETN